LCLALCCASAAVGAREIRLLTANGEGGSCPEITAAVAEADARAAGTPRPPAATAHARAAKPTTLRGDSDGNGRAQPPRWHSFLPGMFR
jgi:hypothetical protein